LKAKVGDQLVLTTDGSVGSDIKFTVNPPTVNFIVVKLVDEKDNIGVVFTPVRTGTYQIVMMLNQDGKTGFTTLTVSVEAPPPPPVPEKEYFPLREAYNTDRKADAQAPQYLAQLERFYAEWDKIADKNTNWEGFMKMYKDVGNGVIGTNLPSVRSAIRNYVANRFPALVDAPYDKELIKTVQSEILTTLKLVK
jgi:hypothetical protein